MRLLVLPVVLAGAVAVNALGESATMIVADLQSIQNLTEGTIKAINAFNGSLDTALPITAATNDVQAKITNATTEAMTASPFSDSDATALGPYTQNLAYAVNSSIAALIGKKPEFEALNLGAIVLSSLETQKNASMTFSNAVSMLVPENTRSVAKALSSQTIESIQQGIDCFSGKNETCNPTNFFEAKAMAEAAEKAANGAMSRSAAGSAAVMVAGLVAYLAL